MSASFCSVWASGLLSWANWACMICILRHDIKLRSVHCGVLHIYTARVVLEVAVCPTCSCSAVKDVRALLAGLG